MTAAQPQRQSRQLRGEDFVEAALVHLAVPLSGGGRARESGHAPRRGRGTSVEGERARGSG